MTKDSESKIIRTIVGASVTLLLAGLTHLIAFTNSYGRMSEGMSRVEKYSEDRFVRMDAQLIQINQQLRNFNEHYYPQAQAVKDLDQIRREIQRLEGIIGRIETEARGQRG